VLSDIWISVFRDLGIMCATHLHVFSHNWFYSWLST